MVAVNTLAINIIIFIVVITIKVIPIIIITIESIIVIIIIPDYWLFEIVPGRKLAVGSGWE